MPFIERRDGVIASLYETLQLDENGGALFGDEFLADDDPEVLAFWEKVSPPIAPIPSLVAMGQIKIADGDVSEVKISAALAGAFLFGAGEIWCFFVAEQPDTDYIVLAYDSNSVRAYVEDDDKDVGYFIIRATDFAGVPTNPASLNFEVKRVI